MSSVPRAGFEGDGEEIARYASKHPRERFRLIELSQDSSEAQMPSLAKALEIVERFRGKLPILPLEATSTDSLYD